MRYVLILLAALGIVVSALALREHYRTDTSPCSINERWDCGIVNHSPYAMLAGIPVAVLGIAGYLLMGALAARRAYRLAAGSSPRWIGLLSLPGPHRGACPWGVVHLLRHLPRRHLAHHLAGVRNRGRLAILQVISPL